MASMTINHEEMRAEKKNVARNSVLVAIVMTLFKFIVGSLSGSLGILSEALHSLLDLVASTMTLYSVRMSDKPADADHQYGYGKIENFSAFLETGLLFITCVWIVWAAGHRLFFRNVEIEPSIWAVLVMGVSIALDAWRSRALKRVADKYNSQALQADALNFATDIWSSSVVIAGLGFVWAGARRSMRCLMPRPQECAVKSSSRWAASTAFSEWSACAFERPAAATLRMWPSAWRAT
jgi:cation diffusion facilitator family transporter